MFEPASGAVVASRYRLVREIGRGGMGAVWEAFDLELEAPCALKFILDEESKPPEIRVRFLREARAVARLQSPHVVTIRSVGEWEGALFIAMELLVGETLFDRLARQGKLSVAETARVVEQLASALLIAHRANIVHRDLKPENIWLWGDGEPFVKLLDFGIAKLVAEPNSLLRTATGKVIGTPHYMSPEQAAGDRQVDHRSDLWSLAVIAVECLSGKRVFQAGGMGQLLANIINGPTPSLLSHYPNASPALLSWWDRSTAKHPAERYGSAPELSREFTFALGLARRSNELPSSAVAGPVVAKHGISLTERSMGIEGPGATLTSPSDATRDSPASSQTQSVLPLSSTRSDVVLPQHPASASSQGKTKAAIIAAAAALLGATWVVLRQPSDAVVNSEPAPLGVQEQNSNVAQVPSPAPQAASIPPALPAGMATIGGDSEGVNLLHLPVDRPALARTAAPVGTSVASPRTGRDAASWASKRTPIAVGNTSIPSEGTAAPHPTSAAPADTEDPVGF